MIFAYHGYPWLIHRLTYRRSNHDGLHVRGYKEEGTTTTPFDMVMLNDMDRFHLVMDVIDRVPGLGTRAAQLRQLMADRRLGARVPTRARWATIRRTSATGHGRRWRSARRRPGARRARLSPRVRILVVNAGSSSLKLRLLAEDDASLGECELAAPRAEIDADEVREVVSSELGAADVVGHRIVHGGERFRSAVRVDADVSQALLELTALAPLHQPKSLAALEAVSSALPDIPAVACFDTAFHATIPPGASTYALPAAWRDRWPLRRFGFHGLSHAWVARRAPELTRTAGGRPADRELPPGRGSLALRDPAMADPSTPRWASRRSRAS